MTEPTWPSEPASDLPSGMESFETGVDFGGLMSVLSEHLYSTPDVALRELVQNAHDSITRRRLLTGQPAEGPAIAITASPEHAVIHVSDNGSGLTEDEIHRYLATVGVGATRGLRESTPDPELIGLFGLGFLSCFVVAKEVVVTTTSCTTPNETHQYRSSDGRTYSVLPAAQRAVGTTVTLHLNAGSIDLAEPTVTAGILKRYCRLLGAPITINGTEPINLDPPWRHETSTAEQRLAFAESFDARFEPLVAIPVTTEQQWLRGQLWVHGTSTYGNADNRSMAVYVRGMLLAENDIDLLPRWAGFVSGVVESSDLTPTASRETLQKDASYAEAQMALSEALITGLSNLALIDPVTWRRVLDRHGQAMLGAAVSDDRLFQLVADQVTVPTSQGDRTVAALRHGRRLHVSLGAERGFEELLFLARGIPVARGDRYGVLPFLRTYADRHSLELIEVGADQGNEQLFEADTISVDDLAWLQQELAGPDEAVYPARFEPEQLPLVVIPDREAELKKRIEDDELGAATGAAAGLARIHTAGIEDRPPVRLYVNTACPTVTNMLRLRHANPVGAYRAVTILRTIKSLMAASDRGRGGEVNLTAVFSDALNVIDGFLLEIPSD